MAIYATRAFARFARRNGISRTAVLQVARDVMAGLADADLGGGVYKQRVARRGSGSSRGFRLLVMFKRGSHVFFARGFAKNEQANISVSELAALKEWADVMFRFNDARVAGLLESGALEIIDAH